MEFHVFQFASISLIISLVFTKSLALSFSPSTHQVICMHYKISSNHFLQLNNASCHVLIGQMLQSVKHLVGPTMNSLQYANIFLVFRSPELDTRLKFQSHSADQRGIITSLDLQVILFLRQARMLLAFFANRTHCWLNLICL